MSKKSANGQGGNPTEGGENIKRDLILEKSISLINSFDTQVILSPVESGEACKMPTVPCVFCGKPCTITPENYMKILLLHAPVVCTAKCLEEHTGVPVERPVKVTWEN